jgi:NADP-dependent 3-hydroxy acid dehydrogenase YdfG
VAVVTGAARGLGAELARRLAARGAAVALLGLRLRRLDGVVRGCGPDAARWEVDVAGGGGAGGRGGVLDRIDRVDVVVANAGDRRADPLLLATRRRSTG